MQGIKMNDWLMLDGSIFISIWHIDKPGMSLIYV